MAVKGTWTVGSPPNHLPTVLGAVALVVLLAVGLDNHADQNHAPSPTPSPTATATPTHTPSPPAVRASVAPVRPRPA